MTFQRFPRVQPLLILLFSLASLGLYVPYWLYTRTRILNSLCPQQPVPTVVVALSMGSLLVFAVMLYQLMGQLPAQITLQQLQDHPGFQKLMDVAMVINLLQLLWALLFCHRLNLCTRALPGDPRYSSYFFLALSHILIVNIFYLQYKINQLIDENIPNQSTIGLM